MTTRKLQIMIPFSDRMPMFGQNIPVLTQVELCLQLYLSLVSYENESLPAYGIWSWRLTGDAAIVGDGVQGDTVI
jgi:hypothetical protein